jgi:hypothetical protein
MCEKFEQIKWVLEPELRKGCPFAGSCAGCQANKDCRLLEEIAVVDAKSQENSTDLPLAF